MNENAPRGLLKVAEFVGLYLVLFGFVVVHVAFTRTKSQDRLMTRFCQESRRFEPRRLRRRDEDHSIAKIESQDL